MADSKLSSNGLSNKLSEGYLTENDWAGLKRYTDARIALGRAGTSIPTQAMLSFQMDHGNARDAVHLPLDIDKLCSELQDQAVTPILLKSRAQGRTEYLQRPDLGRRLSVASAATLTSFAETIEPSMQACITIVDGLSSFAIQSHAANFFKQISLRLKEEGITQMPPCLVEQGRVAVGDEIGDILNAQLMILLVGERPGLSSPDSLGVYFTYKPKLGFSDANRNCISNIRPAGMSYEAAADKLIWLIKQSLQLDYSGVELKDQSDSIESLEEPKLGNFLLD
ncbi:ethanolamine ammonia-lyase subunit EutC [Neptuniibacter sp. 2_MG-2023]|uniref:ethanolamine ammonia-lyase subunit EutC n=1 Tax=Neptuniibacter sp. 2_MG-2023 TaxID=3062671 RepID=UPI0026E414F0|nr:ethanolamine ammonia-lyase subunit EutC [Neptuniibacter sp. 2_MG-2023]MDO6513527.1 ethanolamine ammonia-lyase subunit EutC [Neptuniibacter sp. 2_MG-2023]